MKILSSTEKKKLLALLKQQFGIETLPFLLLRFGKEKVRGFTGSLSREEISLLDKELRIESAGLYLLHQYEQEIRLSLDAIHMLKDQIKKSIIELNEKQAESWFNGEDIRLETDKEIQKGFVILKHKDDFIGCGKSLGFIIKNYMPKTRRIKS